MREEDILTTTTAAYLELLKSQRKVLCYTHINNEMFTKSWAIKAKNKRMGVRPGVPDMLIVFPTHILFLELKRLKNGVLSTHQKEWISHLKKAGISVAVTHGWEETKLIIDNHIHYGETL